MMRLLAPLLLSIASSASNPTPDPARFAIVIGNNLPLPGSGYEPLQFADDDALRFAQFFGAIGAKVALFTTPDRESAARFVDLANSAQPPTRDRILKAIEAFAGEIQAERGRPTELYFYFSGHGSVGAAEAHLHLADGPFSRTDLYERVLRRVAADRVHVIIDSCHAYFLVNARGRRVPADDSAFDLARYPHVGFLLSTSSSKEVHEWSGYQAGVFSYQVLGALQGAADVDRDGIVTYGELHAYVVAANLRVTDARARIEPFIRNPVIRGDTLVDLNALTGQIRVPTTIGGHFHIIDARGHRVLDANKPKGEELRLALRSDAGFELELEDKSARYAVGRSASGESEFAVIPAGVELASRGAVADEFRAHLFERPLTAEFVAGLEALLLARSPAADVLVAPVVPRWTEDPWTLGLLGGGAAAVIGGVIANVLFLQAKQDADRRPVTTETDVALGKAEDRRALMFLGYGVGAALLGSGLIRVLEADR